MRTRLRRLPETSKLLCKQRKLPPDQYKILLLRGERVTQLANSIALKRLLGLELCEAFLLSNLVQ